MTPGEAAPRTRDEIVDRALALLVVAGKAEGAPRESVANIVANLGAAPFFSPLERAFIDDPKPDADTMRSLVWRYEALHALAWALGLVEALPEPTRHVDAPALVRTLLTLGPRRLRTETEVRPLEQIRHAADLHLRRHRAGVEARQRGASLPAPIVDVVFERLYALTWLVAGEPWDDVQIRL